MSQNVAVLVVDDDPDIRSVLVAVLEGGGYHVDTASNGAEALRKANQYRPDVVILDAHLLTCACSAEWPGGSYSGKLAIPSNGLAPLPPHSPFANRRSSSADRAAPARATTRESRVPPAAVWA